MTYTADEIRKDFNRMPYAHQVDYLISGETSVYVHDSMIGSMVVLINRLEHDIIVRPISTTVSVHDMEGRYKDLYEQVSAILSEEAQGELIEFVMAYSYNH